MPRSEWGSPTAYMKTLAVDERPEELTGNSSFLRDRSPMA